MNVNPVNMRNADEIERAIETFARTPNGGLIVAAGALHCHRDLIIALTDRHKLPAIYHDKVLRQRWRPDLLRRLSN